MHANALTTAARLSDHDLLERLEALAGRERHATVELIAHLAELDRRKLHREQGYGSLFSYCTEALRLSEHATFNRIEAARASRRFPVILDLLGEGVVNLSTLRLLAPHLTAENHKRVLEEARGHSKREVEAIVARLAPQPDMAASVRKLPVTGPAPRVHGEAPAASAVAGPAAEPSLAPTAAPPFGAEPPASLPPRSTRPVVAALSPERYRVQFTVSRATQEKLRRLQDLLRREIPDGDPGAIFDRALTLLLADVERKKLAATTKPRRSRPADPHSRHVPAADKRNVWQRDASQCAFVAANGRRCTQRVFLEVHHVHPHGRGGLTTTENLALRCREHNVFEAERVFGAWDPGAVSEPRTVYSSWSGAIRGKYNELGPTRPGASWGRRNPAMRQS